MGVAVRVGQYLAKYLVNSRPSRPASLFLIDTEPLLPSNVRRFRKLMGMATIFYVLAATLFVAKVFGDLPNVLMLPGVGLSLIGLYFNFRALAEMRR